MAPGYARSLLPLSSESTNQHITHQAALVALAGDYTGGATLATLLPDVPIAGVHPRPRSTNGCPATVAMLWLTDLQVSYLRPSTADLYARCMVADADARRVPADFAAGERVLIPLEVSFETDVELVASGVFTYFLRRSDHVRSGTRSALARHLAATSARLIAGIRGLQAEGPRDPWSAIVAGRHGRLLAERFTEALPQLPQMVIARTQSADRTVAQALDEGVTQFVMIGVGLDCRSFRLFGRRRDVTVFELDTPAMLAERERALRRVADAPAVERIGVELDLGRDDVAAALRAQARFDPCAPVACVCEGVSMYMTTPSLANLVDRLAPILNESRSRLWVDVVDPVVTEGASGFPEVDRFVAELARLGDTFIGGLDNPQSWFSMRGYRTSRIETCGDVLGRTDPLLGLYRFLEVRRG
jgi:methyltransferase (TIGR00027 family)